MRTIKTHSGIGDVLWMLQKLVATKEKFHFRIADGHPRRTKPLLDLLPDLCESCTYDPTFGHKQVRAFNAGKGSIKWAEIKDNEFFLECNTRLELGGRLEDFLSDLPVKWQMEYATTHENKKEAEKTMLNSSSPLHKKIGIYASSSGKDRWPEENWMEFLTYLKNEYDPTFVFIGCWDDNEMFSNLHRYDDLTRRLCDNSEKLGWSTVNAMALELGGTIELFKLLDYFIGFQSGLSMINETLYKDNMMLYRDEDKRIIGTWAHPGRIANSNILERAFFNPEDIFQQIKKFHPL